MFKEVNFSHYRGNATHDCDDGGTLRDISFEIEKGMVVGVVGYSGSGKSTLLSLLLRLYVPSSGSILFDELDIGNLDLECLRKNIGYVSQETPLFNLTIKENIRLGKQDATDNDIFGAATLAHADSFIGSLELGYDTLVGDRGSTLSGGQKQRIAIAQALVRKPEILILDEATSALDSVNEKAIVETLKSLEWPVTIIIASHRLSSLAYADMVIVFKEGEIVEIGSIEKLLEDRGTFYDLTHRQRGGSAHVSRSTQDE